MTTNTIMMIGVLLTNKSMSDELSMGPSVVIIGENKYKGLSKRVEKYGVVVSRP